MNGARSLTPAWISGYPRTHGYRSCALCTDESMIHLSVHPSAPYALLKPVPAAVQTTMTPRTIYWLDTDWGACRFNPSAPEVNNVIR